ncbi:AraC-like DNA-binding protein [Blastococcus saxobsidens]|uniref:AraC-like DNA-binding protein n=2 Tax=Blastococcus saxobsidens TaxID=138336 RepID=A0A4Q7Y5B8_9ACTN|nr:AraC-like DNA-binding protein [Blastococcus saxobsidens]
MPTASIVSSVTTVGVEPADRLAFWEHYNAEALVGLTCSSYAAEGLIAKQLNLDLGGFRVADIAGNPHVIERGPQLVRSQPKDAVFATLLLEGEAFFYHGNGCLRLDAGDVIVYETDAPYLFGFSTAMRQVLVDVPRRLFFERCAPALEGPLKVAGDGVGTAGLTARALSQMLLGLVEDPVVAPVSAGDHLLDLLEVMTTGRGTPTSTGRLLAAKEFIAARLGDADLCTDRVADALGVTARHLNRTFAAEGTTVAQYIQGRRLDAARVDLTARSMRAYRIADIATRWGFASQAHFTRSFRARFGCTPSEVRASGVL